MTRRVFAFCIRRMDERRLGPCVDGRERDLEFGGCEAFQAELPG